MIEWIHREAVYLWYYLDIQIRQIAPYWALGIVLGSAVSVFGKKYIHGAFAKIGRRKMGGLGVIPASLLGIGLVRSAGNALISGNNSLCMGLSAFRLTQAMP